MGGIREPYDFGLPRNKWSHIHCEDHYLARPVLGRIRQESDTTWRSDENIPCACRVRDLPAAARWFEKVWQIAPVFNNERMVWLSFGELGVILDAAADDSIVTIGFYSNDCDPDYRLLTSRGAEPIEQPQDKPWGTRTAYLKGPGGLTIEIEQLLNRT